MLESEVPHFFPKMHLKVYREFFCVYASSLSFCSRELIVLVDSVGPFDGGAFIWTGLPLELRWCGAVTDDDDDAAAADDDDDDDDDDDAIGMRLKPELHWPIARPIITYTELSIRSISDLCRRYF